MHYIVHDIFQNTLINFINFIYINLIYKYSLPTLSRINCEATYYKQQKYEQFFYKTYHFNPKNYLFVRGKGKYIFIQYFFLIFTIITHSSLTLFVQKHGLGNTLL